MQLVAESHRVVSPTLIPTLNAAVVVARALVPPPTSVTDTEEVTGLFARTEDEAKKSNEEKVKERVRHAEIWLATVARMMEPGSRTMDTRVLTQIELSENQKLERDEDSDNRTWGLADNGAKSPPTAVTDTDPDKGLLDSKEELREGRMKDQLRESVNL